MVCRRLSIFTGNKHKCSGKMGYQISNLLSDGSEEKTSLCTVLVSFYKFKIVSTLKIYVALKINQMNLLQETNADSNTSFFRLKWW